ncbi:sialoadhesin-like [Paramisgurnus dabryanus]|uniref:sialoadhesin-like n=1 Tax=Paramisgurnus dabryanus TaxID=90735 RepID=UPI003CCF820A
MKALIYLLFQGVLLYETLAWEVRMPSEIRGLKGSCLVIPCSYSYTSNPPTKPRRVVWYQYVWSGYPIVYDPWYPDSVIYKFRGKTDTYNPKNSNRDCSLLIKSVDPSHNGEKLYTWIDPENIGKSTYKFYDVTSTIIVDTNPQQPIINNSGGLKIGDSITVACYTLHTCPYRKPNIVLKGIEGSDKIDDVHIKNGQWKTTLTRTGVVKAERSDIECTVTHHGGRTTRATKSQSAKCVHYNITIEPQLAAEIIEGVAKTFTCTVQHSCQTNPPILSWNYENMPVKDGKKPLTGFELATFSTITFLGAKKDDGKKLICTTNISGQKITASVDLHVQQPSKPVTPVQDFTEPPKSVTPVQNKSASQNKSDVMTFKTTGLYILAPSFAFLLICIFAGVIIYKNCNRSNDLYAAVAVKTSPKARIPSPNSSNDLYAAVAVKTSPKARIPSPKRYCAF